LFANCTGTEFIGSRSRACAVRHRRPEAAARLSHPTGLHVRPRPQRRRPQRRH
jgi:hypothetical protein